MTVVEALPAPLAHVLPPELASACVALHLDHGVDLRCGRTVAGFDGNEHVEAVRLDGGETVPADVVVVGIGVIPETSWLVSSGLALDNGRPPRCCSARPRRSRSHPCPTSGRTSTRRRSRCWGGSSSGDDVRVVAWLVCGGTVRGSDGACRPTRRCVGLQRAAQTDGLATAYHGAVYLGRGAGLAATQQAH